MDQNEVLRRYLDLGTTFTQVTRERVEDVTRELVRLGDLQRGQAQQWVDEILERSRKNTEALLDLIREEVARQVSSLNLVTRDDITRLVTRLTRAPSATRKPSVKKTAKKAPTKKAPATKAKKAPAKKTTAKKTTAKKAAPAKRSTKKAGS